jgi:hypothetical protein
LLQWYNHGASLNLEAQARKKIDQKIHEKVNNNVGTWIDWQYLLDAATLLAKVCAGSKQQIFVLQCQNNMSFSIISEDGSHIFRVFVRRLKNSAIQVACDIQISDRS